jgi:hypothetical protein
VNHTEERIIESVSYIFEGRNYNISGGEFQLLIKIEADTYGYVPRNLCMRSEVFEAFQTKMGEAVKDCTKALETIDCVASTTDIKHRLVQIQPPQNTSTGKYNYGRIWHSSWLGNYVISAIVNRNYFPTA